MAAALKVGRKRVRDEGRMVAAMDPGRYQAQLAEVFESLTPSPDPNPS